MKEQIEQAIANTVQAVEDGNADALKAFISLKAVAATITQALKQIEDAAMEELLNYPKGKAELEGAKVEARATAGRWDFKGIQEWISVNHTLKGIEADAKEAAKLAERGKILYDEDGVEVQPAEFTPGKETIFVTLPR